MGKNKSIVIALGVAGIVIVALLGYMFLFREEPQPVPVVQQPVAPVEVPVEEPEPVPEPEVEPEPELVSEPPEVVSEPAAVVSEPAEVVSEPPAVVSEPEPVVVEEEQRPLFALPAIIDSDQLIRDGVASLSGHGGITDWLGVDELIRKFVVLVDNVARGNIPRQHVPFLTPRGKFTVTAGNEEVQYLDERSYSRYDLVTEIFISLDTHKAVEFYSLVKPLFHEAFVDLGYPNRRFEDMIFISIGRLLETPDLPQPIALVQPSVMYKFANPRVERLSPAQKQLIRMGPKNTKVIKEKLSEIALELRKAMEN
jgi:hypothetical protein|tara:strand:+ start:10275 stop:11207 length:933 start_codon:yes stop_codon:yes gene_type:complete